MEPVWAVETVAALYAAGPARAETSAPATTAGTQRRPSWAMASSRKALARPRARTATRSQGSQSTRDSRMNAQVAAAAVAAARVIEPTARSRRSQASFAPMPTSAATAGARATV